MKRLYVYFISYVGIRDNGSQALGNVEITLENKITSIQDIQEVQKNINEQKNLIHAHISFYKLLRVEKYRINMAINYRFY